MAIISNTNTPLARLTMFDSATDQARVNSQQPRGVCTFTVNDSGVGSGLNDQDQFLTTMNFPDEFSYLFTAGRATLTYPSNAYVRDVYQPIVQGIGLFGMEPGETWYSSLKPAAADLDGNIADPSQVARIGSQSYQTYVLPRENLPQMPITQTGLPITVTPQMIITWQQATTVDFSAASWGFLLHFEFLIYDSAQVQGAIFQTPTRVLA